MFSKESQQLLADKEGLYTGHPEVTYPADKPKLKELKLLPADADELEKRNAEIKISPSISRVVIGSFDTWLLKLGRSICRPRRLVRLAFQRSDFAGLGRRGAPTAFLMFCRRPIFRASLWDRRSLHRSLSRSLHNEQFSAIWNTLIFHLRGVILSRTARCLPGW
jgi:hypothetical protein